MDIGQTKGLPRFFITGHLPLRFYPQELVKEESAEFRTYAEDYETLEYYHYIFHDFNF